MAEEHPTNGDQPTRVALNYIKSNFFRVIHADGCHGGITPQGFVQMAIFSERLPIPQRVVYQLSPQGVLIDPPMESIGREGAIREVEVEMLMTPEMARSLGAWLLDKAKQFDAATKGSS